MAIRYIGIAFEDRSAWELFNPDAPVLRDMVIAYKGRRLLLYVDNGEAYCRLGSKLGAAVGYVFDKRSADSKMNFLDDHVAAKITADHRYLLQEYWGGYCAFIEDAAEGTVHVIRDPSRFMPCYYTSVGGVKIFCSDVETLHRAGLLQTEFNWDFFPRHFAAGDLISHKTAFRSVSDLLPGTELSIEGASLFIRTLWTPWEYANLTISSSFQHAVEAVHETTSRVVNAWAHCFQRPLLGVSGGLDSSIVACQLRAAQSDVTCLTLATDEPSGDERKYARCLAEHLGLPLREAFYDLSQVDVCRPTVPHLPRPCSQSFVQSAIHIQKVLAHDIGADAFFSGVGGDNVFCLMQSASPIVDRLRSRGSPADVLRTLRDVCELTGCSVWDAIRMSLIRHRRKDPTYLWRTDLQYLTPSAAMVAVQDMGHGWLSAPVDAFPGKAAHISMLVRLQGTPDEFSRYGYGPQVTPLSSQPLVELCLKIPTWQWCTNGENRAIARRAFASCLPKELLTRKVKGGPSSFAYQVIQTHKALIGERLCNGNLVSNGILNKIELQPLFLSSHNLLQSERMKISAMSEAEEWIRYWIDIGRPAKDDALLRTT